MSISVAALFVRNVYAEFFFPTATPKHQLKVGRVVSLIAKVGALAFVFGLRNQDAINLQLLGGVWILQTFPTVVFGLFSSWFHRRGLIFGWGAGIVTGTLLVVSGGFSWVLNIGPDRWAIQLYAGLVALIVNVMVVVALNPMLRRYDLKEWNSPAEADPQSYRSSADVT